MTEQKQYGADLVVDSLINHDIDYVFGIPGAKIDRIFDTLEGYNIRMISYGASTNNICMLAHSDKADDVVRSLHKSLFE